MTRTLLLVPAICGVLLSAPSASADEEAPETVIQISNPAETQVTWKFLVDGELRTLEAGQSLILKKTGTITFDKGKGKGEASYALEKGTYTFFREEDGSWELYQSEGTQAADEASMAAEDEGEFTPDPETPAEVKMFQEMYGEAGLDEEDLKVLSESWKNSTSQRRKAAYDDFMAKIAEATKGLMDDGTAESTPAEEKPEPVTEAEEKWFQEMYGDAQLDADTLKIVREAWNNSTRAKRQADYEAFMAKVNEMAKTAETAAEAKPAPTEPVTAEERQYFKEMYSDAGFDQETLKLLAMAWKDSSHEKRKADYEAFQAKVAEAAKAAEAMPDEKPESTEAKPEPLTAAEEKMLQEMHDAADLDEETMKTLRAAWENSTAAARKAEYDTFVAEVAKAAENVVMPAEAEKPEPVTAEEEKMFQEMYGDADLDAETLKAVKEAWDNSTSRNRLADFKAFQAKVAEAEESAKAAMQEDEEDDAEPEPVTAAEEKMFQEMYADAGLDAETLKLVQEAWKNSTGKKRQATYDKFQKAVKEAEEAAEKNANTGEKPTEEPANPSAN